MKSSCLTIGAWRLAKLASDLGVRAAADGFDGFDGAAAPLRIEFECVRAALEASSPLLPSPRNTIDLRFAA